MVAMVRDPYDRLISAWKSKFMCGKNGVDGSDRARMVPQLLRLAQVPRGKRRSCLTLADFAMVVQQVYLQGNACKLDRHVRPQSLGCFSKIAPQNYTLVTTAATISALYPAVFRDMPHKHKSSQTPLDIDPTTQAILRQLASLEGWLQKWL